MENGAKKRGHQRQTNMIFSYVFCLFFGVVTCFILNWQLTSLVVVSVVAWFFAVASMRDPNQAPSTWMSTLMFRRLFDAELRAIVNQLFVYLMQGPKYVTPEELEESQVRKRRGAVVSAGRAGGLAQLLRLVCSDEVLAQDEKPGVVDHLEKAPAPKLVEEVKAAQSSDPDLQLCEIHYYSTELLEFLQTEPTGSLDFIVVCLDLSRRPRAQALSALKEMTRVATRVLVVDLPVELPTNRTGTVLNISLLAQGPSVWAHALQFRRCGGLLSLAQEAKVKVIREFTLSKGALHVLQLASVETFHSARQKQMVQDAGVD